MSDLTQTVPADAVIATTPEPVSESWQSSIESRLKNQPKIERVDYAKVESGEAAPIGIEEISTMEGDDFLKHLEGTIEEPGSAPEIEEEIEDKKEPKKKAVKEEKKSGLLDISDLDETKDPEPVAEPKKKSKEDNIAELRKKAETFELEAKTKEERLAEYQRKLEEMEGELERTAFERSPRFRDQFQAPFEAAVNKAAAFAEEIGAEQEVTNKALSLKGRERIEYIDTELGGGAAASYFLTLINDAEQKHESLQGALTNYRETSARLAADEQQAHASKLESVSREFDRIANHLNQNSDFFRKGDDEEQNKIIDQRIEAARSIVMGTASKNDLRIAPFLAVVAKDAVDRLEKAEAELAKYKARAKEDSSVTPRISRSSTDDSDEGHGKPRGGLEAIRNQLRGR